MPAGKKTRRTGPAITEVPAALRPYLDQHPFARLDSYSQDPYSIRIRLIDPDFRGLDRGKRHDLSLDLLEKSLPVPILERISILLLLTPEEVATSFANMDFENPIPSDL